MAKEFDPKPGKAIKLTAGLRRIVAPNPSPMTYRGTNTYLLGSRDIAVIDPGPPEEEHLEAILNALEGHQRISHIFVTHSHVDHSPLAMVLAQITGVQVHAFGDSKSGRSIDMSGLSRLGGGEGIDETFAPDIEIADGEEIAGSTWTLQAIHTPGHMGNHLCFGWKEGRAVFTGDHVMGWASSMVSPPDGNLSSFMTSLERLAGREKDQVYYPGHGDIIKDPHARVAELIAHRRSREAEIIEGLREVADIPSLTRLIYHQTAPELHPAAARNILAHLLALIADNRVRCTGEPGPDAEFVLT